MCGGMGLIPSSPCEAFAGRIRPGSGRLAGGLPWSKRLGDDAHALDYRICYSRWVGDWDIYLTSKAAAWLEDLQASDTKTAGLVDDAIYAPSRSGPALGGRSSTPSPHRTSKTYKNCVPVPAAPARSASCSCSIRGAPRSCWSPGTGRGNGTAGMRRRSRGLSSSTRST